MKIHRLICMVLVLFLICLPPNVGADRSGKKSVVLVDDRQKSVVRTNAETVGGLLNELSDNQSVRRVFPDRNSPIINGSHVFIYRKTAGPQPDNRETVEAESRTVKSWALPAGREMVIRGKRPGTRNQEDVMKQPVDQMVLKGQAEYKNERINELRRKKNFRLLATGYSPHRLDTAPYDDGNSALGLPAGYGVVAVDPKVVPLGTRLYVEGYGYAIAADVGGDIEGKRIDLGFPKRKDALIFGRRWVKVHVLEPAPTS